jgi:tRNA pseudouridine65 synthase
MKHILHPIVGDTKHGEGRHNRLFREHLDSHRLLLMAVAIEFEHPVTGQKVKIESGVGDDVEGLFKRLGWVEGYPVSSSVTLS